MLVFGLTIVIAASGVSLTRDLQARHSERVRIPANMRGDAVLETHLDETTATAFRTAHAALQPGDRFAVVVAPGIDRTTAGTAQLVSQHYLFPAIAVAEPATADVVVVLGAQPGLLRRRFDPVLDVAGAWVGVRR